MNQLTARSSGKTYNDKVGMRGSQDRVRRGARPRSSRLIDEPIAIVGIGCRFPGGADNPSAFWDLLCSGKDGITEVPKDRWEINRFYDPNPEKPGKMYVRSGGFLRQRIDQFDALFFGISPREALCMDPQQRILLEVAWEAIEDAGLIAKQLAGSNTGVYIGGFMLDNMLTQLSPMNRDLIGAQTAVSSTMSILSNRISYVFDLRGPSITMDTACSSSLVAVHQACQAVWRGECSLALVGGVNIMYRPENPISMCKGQFLSPDGRCKSFDARADGYGRGEGAGIVVLKPVSRAQWDGDRIYGLLCGTGVNQDGRTQGITVPNPESQATLIRQVCAQAGINPRQIRYFEAHGTGTAVGDPLEAGALGAVVGKDRAPGTACVVGSVKANIGHLEAASGIAGLIKTALCLKFKQIPPLANLQTPNPAIPFAELGLRLPRVLEPMPAGKGPAYAGVNSFGYGGTNAHVILKEAPSADKCLVSADAAARSSSCLLPISARSEPALAALAQAYLTRLSGPEAPSLHDLCYSAAVRRTHHDHRLAVVADSHQAMAEQLQSFADHGSGARWAKGKAASGLEAQPVFVFTGMGPQWWAMGRELLQHEPVFRQEALACDAIFWSLAGWSVIAEMTADESRSRIAETQIAQPANFVMQAGLAALWRSWGVEPAAIVGHSVGEVAAAYVAGVLSLEDAVRVSYHRSRIQKKAAGRGTMLAIGVSLQEAEALLAGYGSDVSIAAANSPAAVTLAGASEALKDIAAALHAKGIFNRFLQVEVAYHSPYMDPLLDEVRASLSTLSPQVARLPLYSTVTGSRVHAVGYDAQYWCDNIRRPVLFAKALDALIDDGYRLFLEVGPHPVLSSSIKECVTRRGVRANTIASLRREKPERETLLEGLGALYTSGYPLDWQRLYAAGGNYVRLPVYPWQRETYWKESREALLDRLGDPAEHAFLETRVSAPHPCWESVLNGQRLPYLADHRVDGLVVLPGAAYVEAGLAMHKRLHGQAAFALEDLHFHKAMVVEPSDEPVLRLAYDELTREYNIFSRTREDRNNWTRHASGRMSVARLDAADRVALEELRARGRRVDAATHYDRMEARGLQYGTWFRGIRQLWRSDAEVLAEIEGHAALTDTATPLHPTLLDNCFQSLIAVLDTGDDDLNLYLPVSIRQLRFHASPTRRLWSYGRLTRQTPELIEGDIQLCDEAGKVLVEVRGLRCQVVSGKKHGAGEYLEQWLYQYRWEQSEPEAASGRAGRWLVFLDKGGIGEQLATCLEAAGIAGVVRVSTGTSYEQDGSGRFWIRRHNPEDMERLRQAVGGCQAVAYLWGLDAALNATDPVGVADALSLLQWIQTLGQTERSDAPRLFIVTRGAQQVHAGDAFGSLAQAALVGLGRVACNEYPGARCTLIDIDHSEPNPSFLARELLADSPEDDVALRGGERYGHRLVRVAPSALAPAEEEQAVTVAPDSSYELEADAAGDLAKLSFCETERREPGPGEVEIRVHAVVLTRADLRQAMNRARREKIFYDSARQLTGVVVRVGAGVRNFHPGDVLMACLPGGVSSYVTVPEAALFALPKPVDTASAAGAGTLLPFTAAYHGLCHVARLQRGETLLIRAAAESAAAIQVAKWVGARVIVAVPRAAQPEDLQGQGADHILDSDSVDFAARVMQLTDGRGVDVLLNLRTVASDDLSILAPHGRCLRLGETEITGAPHVAMALALERHLSFATVDVQRLMAERPVLYRQILSEIGARFQAGDFTLPPVRLFPASQWAEAFRELAENLAPVTLSLQDAAVSVRPRKVNQALVRADGTYLITGGFGGFGLEIAAWLVAQGAKHLVLVGRRGAATPAARQAVQVLEAKGVCVLAAAADIGQAEQVLQLVDRIGATMPPLKGVIHAAGVLDDGLLAELDEARLVKVMTPKAMGAWHLHRHTLDASLDFFVLFSSISSLIGNASQGNYVAANVFLDTLAHYRRAQGLPGTSINWGVLGGVGMAAANPEVERRLERMGIKAFTPNQAMTALGGILKWNPVQLGVMDVDWQTWGRFSPASAASPRFSRLVAREGRTPEDSAVAELRRFLRASEPEAAQARFTALLAAQVAATLRLPVDKLDLQESLTHLGGDSLMALELQVGIRESFGIDVSTLALMKEKSIAQLAEQLLAQLLDETDAPPRPLAPAPGPGAAATTLAKLERLSDDEVDKLFDSMLLEERQPS